MGLDKSLVFTFKELWDYKDCWDYQLALHQECLEGKNREGVILCNHPPVITLGRNGNQKGSGHSLISAPSTLNSPYPVYEIERGGGLTFHHPGQWVIYRISKLTPTYSLKDHYLKMLGDLRFFLKKRFNLESRVEINPAGLWVGNQKIASIGVGVKNWWTLHGVALNVTPHPEPQALQNLFPCGMTWDNYTHLSDHISSPHLFEDVKQALLDDLDPLLSFDPKEILKGFKARA